VAGALTSNESQLEGLITNFNRTMAAFASEDTNLAATIRELPPTLEKADTAFDALNRSFPPTRAWALEIIPGIKLLGPTINASFPWITQVEKLVSPAELGGLVNQLQPATADISNLTNQTLKLLPQVDLTNRCVLHDILPTGDEVIQDGNLTTGVPNYKEFWYTLVGLSGEGENFDGNGMYVRFQPGGGSQTVSTGKTSFGGDTLFGNALTKPLGTRPAYPGKRPPYRPDAPCYQQARPNLNAAQTGAADRVVASNRGAVQTGKDGKDSEQQLSSLLARALDPASAAKEGASKGNTAAAGSGG
jgi:phospholipid/cholesterol/gamma-HCH transport system substrate-binding protein